MKWKHTCIRLHVFNIQTIRPTSNTIHTIYNYIDQNLIGQPLMQQNFVTNTSRITGAAGYVPNKHDENCWSC